MTTRQVLGIVLLGSLVLVMSSSAGAAELPPKLREYVAKRSAEFEQIPPERRTLLAELAHSIQAQLDAGVPVRLTFICTHNSRRSHMAQLWALAAAAHHGQEVESFSGGTESSAFNPRAIAALERAGFEIRGEAGDAENPRFQVQYLVDGPAVESFSKAYADKPNPRQGFFAIMTCAQADEACPNVEGAAQRFAIPYEDPKVADGTPEESAVYNERCAQIAREMLYVFSLDESDSRSTQSPTP